MIKRQLLVLITLLFMSGGLWAGVYHDCGAFFLRHQVVTSESLSAESAKMLGVEISPNTGIINIMLLEKASKATLEGRVHVVIKRPSGLMKSLKLRVIKSEDETIFYAAEFDYSGGEVLDFELSVSALGTLPHAFSFSKTLQ